MKQGGTAQINFYTVEEEKPPTNRELIVIAVDGFSFNAIYRISPFGKQGDKPKFFQYPTGPKPSDWREIVEVDIWIEKRDLVESIIEKAKEVNG